MASHVRRLRHTLRTHVAASGAAMTAATAAALPKPGKIASSVDELVGNTPLVFLNRVTQVSVQAMHAAAVLL